jgi:hypothetical protein
MPFRELAARVKPIRISPAKPIRAARISIKGGWRGAKLPI